MNKISIFLMLAVMTAFTSCSKDHPEEDEIMELIQDTAGQIPGLGQTPGEPTGKQFVLPEGIELVGEITGYDGHREPVGKSSSPAAIKASLEKSFFKADLQLSGLIAENIKSVGSGNYVRLAVTLKNTSNNSKTFELPAGLIIKSRSGNYQHGLLLKKVILTIPAHETILTDLYMYCGNLEKSSSSTSEKYDLSVISNSSSIQELIELLKNKKINIEQYLGEENGYYNYTDIVVILQRCLWHITDYSEGLSESDYEEIEAIPHD